MSLDIAAAYSNNRKMNKTILRQSVNPPGGPLTSKNGVLQNPMKAYTSIGRKTLISSIDMSTNNSILKGGNLTTG
jgi:hypothetical protein